MHARQRDQSGVDKARCTTTRARREGRQRHGKPSIAAAKAGVTTVRMGGTAVVASTGNTAGHTGVASGPIEQDPKGLGRSARRLDASQPVWPPPGFLVGKPEGLDGIQTGRATDRRGAHAIAVGKSPTRVFGITVRNCFRALEAESITSSDFPFLSGSHIPLVGI